MLGLRQQGRQEPREGAHLDDQAAPGPTGLPPAVVAGAVAEAQEDREREADKGKGADARGDGKPFGVPLLDRDHEEGERGDHDHLRRDLGQDRAAQGEQDRQQAGAGTDDHGDGVSGRRSRPTGA